MKRNDKSGSFAAVLNFSDKPVKDFEFRAVKLPDDTEDTKESKAAKKSKKIKEETWKVFVDTSWKEYDGSKVKKEAELKSKEGIITTDIGAYEAVIYKIM
jgi:1,4-alpha-glucan branching enzyme